MNYNERKIEFVSNGLGSSVTRINLICSTALTTYSIYTQLSHSVLKRDSTQTAIFEFFILILPLLFSLTIFSAHPLLLNLTLGLISYLLSFSTTPIQPNSQQNEIKLFSKPFITVYRAHMMLMTIFCILAVDFNVFPREFGKAEEFGTSLMDLGVGSFVFSLGLVSALPLLKLKKRNSFLIGIYIELKKSLGVLLLGCIRIIMVKGVDYPEHVTEYGVHWNFFFTLALLPILSYFLIPISLKLDFTTIGLAISILHELLLNYGGLSNWVSTAPRISLLSANKEGLVSLPGYLAIYLLGIATGLYSLPPSPSFFKHLNSNSSSLPTPPSFVKMNNSQTQSPSSPNGLTRTEEEKKLNKLTKSYRDNPGKIASVLGSWAILFWTAHFILNLLGLKVSRQLANLNYVIWTTAFNTSFLLCYLLIHTYSRGRTRIGNSAAPETPIIFEAINRNGLVVFLAANLLTGLVNLTFDTISIATLPAMFILSLYSLAVVGIAYSLRKYRMRL